MADGASPPEFHSFAAVLAGTARWHLHRGDALAFLAALPDASVDAVICDPPYSSGGFTRGDRQRDPSTKYEQHGQALERASFGGDNRDQRSYGYWCALWLGECLRVAKPGAPLVVFTDWRQLPVTTDAIQAGGWMWRGIVPWDKSEGVRPQLGRPRAQCEYAVWGSAGPMPLDRDAPVLPGFFRVVVDRGDKHHLTGKPTALMRELVKITERRGVVLDPFAGSGSTGVGALLEGFRFLGAELSAEYCGVARARLAGAAGEFTDHDALQPSLFARAGGAR